MQHPAPYALIWIAVILAVFIPLAIRQFGRAASR
jgi:ABC-2 type transport system permease protein